MAKTVILAEQDLNFAEDPTVGLYAWYVSPAIFTLEAGQTYTVLWGDKEYTATAEDLEISTPWGVRSCIALGNKMIAGYEDTGEPFAFVYYPNLVDNMSQNSCYTFSIDESRRVAIYQAVNGLEIKILGETGLSRFLNHIKNIFSPTVHNHTKSQITDFPEIPTKMSQLENDIGVEGSGDYSAQIDVIADVGQTIVVKKVDADGKPTEWENADYQPRTHWCETKSDMYCAETTITTDGIAFGLPAALISEVTAPLVSGHIYDVMWNETKYSCIAFYYDAFDSVCIGNKVLISSNEEDTGEPFIMSYYPLYGGFGIITIQVTTATLSITERIEIVHKLDEIYIPDSVTINCNSVPAVTTNDNGKILQVVNGEPLWVEVRNSAVNDYIDSYINEALGGDY